VNGHVNGSKALMVNKKSLMDNTKLESRTNAIRCPLQMDQYNSMAIVEGNYTSPKANAGTLTDVQTYNSLVEKK